MKKSFKINICTPAYLTRYSVLSPSPNISSFLLFIRSRVGTRSLFVYPKLDPSHPIVTSPYSVNVRYPAM